MTEKMEISQWRKIAMATWDRRTDPMIFASMDIDFENGLKYLEAVRKATGVHVTPVHLVGRGVARVLDQMPGLNGRIVWRAWTPAPTIDVFFTVSLRTDLVEGGTEAIATDLSGTKVSEVDKKPPWVIATELAQRAERIRSNQDPQFKRTKVLSEYLPPLALRAFLALTTFVTEELQLPIPPLGLEARPFGSFLVTNVGTFGLDSSFAPLPTVSRIPGAVVVGTVTEKPVVRDGEIVIRHVLPLGASIDHRFIDGYQGAVIARIIREYLEDPAKFDPVPEAVPKAKVGEAAPHAA